MIYIRKGNAPRSLIEYRSKPNANYDDFRDKPGVRRALLAEQGFLCAYCMKRIRPDTMKIEHLYPQNPDEESSLSLALDYNNMLGVCDGFEGLAGKHQTCDSHKGNTKLGELSPFDKQSIEKIAYKADGTIYSKDKMIDSDLNTVLNLNGERSYLKKNRRAVITQLQRYLKENSPQGTWNLPLLRRILRKYETEVVGEKPEYVGAILYFIKRYMRKAE